MADQGTSVASGAEQGAAAGSVAGPYGALAGGAAGAIAGLIGSGQGESTIDLSALYSTIQNAGQYQQQIINSLPAEIQANLKQYAATQDAAGSTYQSNIQGQGANYLAQVQGLYGPNSDAATAANAANKAQIYSTVPGSENAIRQAMAATGGLSRGNAGAAIAAPVMAAAQQYGQSAANTTATQTAAGQGATAQALATVNSMDATAFQNLFGMSKDQATTILNTGNATLQNQLAQLITQSTNQTNQMLGVEGTQAQNGYQNALQQAGNQNAIYTGLANAGINGLAGWSSTPSTSTGMDTTSPAYMANAAANNPNNN
jgi:hypothetical protein